jgi:hypothetical protein
LANRFYVWIWRGTYFGVVSLLGLWVHKLLMIILIYARAEGGECSSGGCERNWALAPIVSLPELVLPAGLVVAIVLWLLRRRPVWRSLRWVPAVVVVSNGVVLFAEGVRPGAVNSMPYFLWECLSALSPF